MKRIVFALLAVVISTGFAFGQTATGLRFVGVDGTERQIAPADVAKLKRVTVKASAHGTRGTFEGYSLGEVLGVMGVEFGEKLRGPSLASYLLVEAADGYQVIFALPELDPGFTDKVVIIADRRDGKVLAADEGPFRLVVPDEKRPARWARQVTTLRIVNAAFGKPTKH